MSALHCEEINMPKPQKHILLVGNYRPALAMARVLKSAGYHVIMGKRGGEGFSELSRFVDRVWDHPTVEDDKQGFIRELPSFLKAHPEIQTVFPVTEKMVMCFAEHPEIVPDGVTLVSPDVDLVKICADKLSMLELAEKAEVPILPFAVLRSKKDAFEQGKAVGLPMVARPLSAGARFGHKKAAILKDWEAFSEFVEEWCGGSFDILIQRQAIGPRRNVFFLAQNGELLQSQETLILRTDYADGTGVAVSGVTCDATEALTDDCRRMLKQLNYTGIGVAQFILDPKTGDRCFLELNPRIAGSQAITEQLGFAMCENAIALAEGVHLDKDLLHTRGRSGIRYAWTYGDLRGLKAGLSRGEVGYGGAMLWAVRMVWAAIRADRHMTWWWRDPIPTCFLFAAQLFPRFVAGLETEFEPEHVSEKNEHRVV
jgi:carbamoylphosphate synthase large subunit